MNTTVFFLIALAAVAAVWVIIAAIGNDNNLTKIKFFFYVLAIVGIGFGVYVAYDALPTASGCASCLFTLIEVAIAFFFLFYLWNVVAKYVIGVALLALAGYVMYWLFDNAVADGSVFGSIIAFGTVLFALLCGVGLFQSIKLALKK